MTETTKQKAIGETASTHSDSLNGAEVVLRALHEQGVEVIFGYPGGAVLPLYDALFKQNVIRHILVRHEQAAVHAAEGYARSTGKVGVVLVTSGPGATNTVTGLLDALMDSIPVVCLTGQVPTTVIGTDAFQEADTTGITRPVTKHNYLVRRPEDLASTIHEAFYIARSGRPGPVVIDLPKDVVSAPAPYISAEVEAKASSHRSYHPARLPPEQAVYQAVMAMKRAKKPLLYVGGGVINSGPYASEALRRLVALTDFPTTTTLMGLGSIAGDDPHFLGMLGMHGTYEANLATHGCDVLVALGARFDDRVTSKLSGFSPHSLKIHVDIDPSQMNKVVNVDIPIIGDVGETMKMMCTFWEKDTTVEPHRGELQAWWQQIEEWRAVQCLTFVQDKSENATIKPQYAIQRLSEISAQMGKDVFVTTEVGQHQMWTAQHFNFTRPNQLMTSGGLGTMGYGFPSSMGVQIAHPDALVLDIAGEASTLMNIQELATVAQYRLPVKMIILNNRYMGMVRQWQELLYDKRYSQSYSESLPDFVKLAESFSVRGMRATTVGELDDVLTEALAYNGSVVVELAVETVENCYPMIPPGAAHNQILLDPALAQKPAGGS
ncbi:biosynthetic-type acetolactate synthase large subunit [Entomobacter blattae]|uniref:Acetolactate synthase n=1 Tax=Entomobacter blattae TaxID=2762277 RepID=A0A7H1NRF0_9PROT|nr:biosynthetic-type acetolactate synthase large subunit [Entomobacter blattae]QNT78360.1 Acetolactate synthase isozyme 3 large subunit [Entomobacter blattae]